MSLTKSQIQAKYPEVYESYSLQASLPEAKYVEKLKFWENSSINCFERWTIPYFLEREKEKKRPCLRLNYPPDGKCNDCLKGTCRYDKICFMCGQEGHGAFQSYPGGKLKGELKCAKHRNFLSQLGMIRLQHGIDEEGLKVLFKLPGYQAEKPAAAAGKKVTSTAKATAAGATEAAAAKGGAADTTGKATTAPNAAPATASAPAPATNAAEASNDAPASAAASATPNASANAKSTLESQQAALTAAIGAEVSKVAHKPSKGGANQAPAANATAGGKTGTAAKTAPSAVAAPAPVLAPASAPAPAPIPASTPTPIPVTSTNASPSLSGLAGSTTMPATLNGNWQLNLDGTSGGQNLSGLGSALLGNGSGLNYDSLLGSSALEDNGRRPWATATGAAPATDNALLGPMSGLLPNAPGTAQGQLPQGSRLNGLHLAAGGMPPMPPLTGGLMPSNGSLMPGLGGGLGLMPGFDALNLGSPVAGNAGQGSAPNGVTPQAGFGSTLAGLQMPLPGALGAGAMQQQFQQVFEVVDVDEYVAPGTLRVTLNALVADHTGAFTTKGAYMTHRGVHEVQVRCWRRPTANTPGGGAAPGVVPTVDMAALRAEVRALRTLSRRTAHASRLLHHGVLELSHHPTGDFLSLLSDSSELGTLDRFTAMQSQLATAAATTQSPTAGAPVNPAQVLAYPVADLQSMCVQLIEGLIQCHELNIRHRDIRPANILVTRCTDELSSRQFNRGLVLKYTNFVPTALLPLCHHSAAGDAEQERWLAPEVDFDARRNGTRFQAGSDVWSLGLTIYYLASGGQLPFDSHKQAVEAAANPDYRRQCLEKHGLHERLPMLYDLVERLVRPAYMRTDLQIIRCHPFLWTLETRRSMLIQFANSTMLRNNDTINALVTGIDKISPLYVFGADGWVPPMAPFLAALIPAKIKQELGWSGTYLLQAIKSQLSYPELLTQSVYPRMTAHQATHAYIRQITDVDFPRLLILLYELGGIHGKWLWDGDEISHTWN